MDQIYQVKEVHKEIKNKIIVNEQQAKMVLNRTNQGKKEEEQKMTEEEKKWLQEEFEKSKPPTAQETELKNLRLRVARAELALRKDHEKTTAMQKALKKSEDNIQKAKDRIKYEDDWKAKIEKLKKENEQSLVEMKKEYSTESNERAKVETELKDVKAKLDSTQKTLATLQKKHEEEVKELFENKHTLKFIKQMKHYKDEWWSKTSDEDRKRIATQMASSTKSWVSASEDEIKKAEKE